MQEMTVFEKPRKSSLQQRRRQSSDYEWVDHLVLKGIVKKSQNISVDHVFIKEEVLQYAKELRFNDSTAAVG